MKFNEINGFVLAGGKSSRMNKDKGFVYYKNIPLVQYPITILTDFCKKIYLNTNNLGYEKFGFEIITDTYLNYGPLGGLITCLEISETETNIFLPVDTPNIPVQLIQYLLKHSVENDITIPAIGNKFEPLIGIYKRSVSKDLLKSLRDGNYSIIEVIKKLKTGFIDINSGLDFYHPEIFKNINTPGEIL